MERLLVIADDFTGALDTGVQFNDRGAITKVVMDPNFDFSKADPSVQVIVLNVESRHIPPLDAYKLVFNAVKNAVEAGIKFIYKKTDSGLRGNIGAELTAALDASGYPELMFIPAFPRMNRNTIDGIHYVDGIPVERSMFGKDPFDPVTKSRVADIIKLQSGVSTFEHRSFESNFDITPGVHVFDSSSEGDMKKISEGLGAERLHLSAGCAAFAASLAHVIGLEGKKPEFPTLPKRLFMACGSVNPITLTQIKNGEYAGFTHVNLTPEQKLDRGWARSLAGDEVINSWLESAMEEGKFILDANDPEGSTALADYMKEHKLTIEEVRSTIAPEIARLTRILIDKGLDATLLCTGGDTLVALMNEVGIKSLKPIAEISTGCVLTHFEYNGKGQYVITKSGGFGTPDVLLKLYGRINATNV